MRFGLMFFASHPGGTARERYATTLAAARLADEAGLAAVWTPERHFAEFGGAFPNPAVLSAAVVTATSRLQVRAGSLISPLHNTVRIAEDWSVVDNLGGGGRIGVSFGSGWNANDFVLAPDRYDDRREVMVRQIEQVRTLWQGDPLTLDNPRGVATEIRLHPRPVSPELPVWVTSSGNPATFDQAGALGANLLTHLIGQDVDELADKLVRYRKAREAAGFDPAAGVVSLMLHTFVDEDHDRARALTRQPFREYLRSAVVLERTSAGGGGTISGGHRLPTDDIPADLVEELLDVTYERYVDDAALIGSPDRLTGLVHRLDRIGVDEIAALVDFGPTDTQLLDHLPALFRLARDVR
jgi:natural product biosynthesis luciferase-like monooxygenase protein